MKNETINELKQMLEICKATKKADPIDGGRFYKIKSQSFTLPSGEEIVREFIDKKQSTIVLPITKDGKILFIIQPIALSKEGSLIELPAGYVEANESSLDAGVRELIEETGYVGNEVISLGEHYQDPGSIKETVQIFAITNCEKKEQQKLDKDEYIKYVEISYNEAMELLDLGYIKDANTFIALSKYDRYINSKQNSRKAGL